MAPPTPASLRALRQSLPPFTEAAGGSPELQAFCRFYGIDFSTAYPQAEHRVGTVASGTYRLAVHQWCQPGATSNLLLVHGYTDHSGLFGKLVEYGLQRGCNVLIFDLPGHGLSSGDPAAIDDFTDYGRAVADVLACHRLPVLPWWAMAQSTGCPALVEYARLGAWPFSATVLLAPLIRPAGWGRVRAGHLLLQRFVEGVPRKFGGNSSDPVFLAFHREDPLQSPIITVRWIAALKRWLKQLEFADLGVGPALVLQGDQDATVAWRYNLKRIVKLFPGSTVQCLPGARHQLANESGEIRSAYLALVDDYLARRMPPAGAGAGSGEPAGD